MGLLTFLLAAALAAKDPPLRNLPASTYAARDAHDGVTIAAEPYDTPEKSKQFFGKYDPLKVGIMPVLLTITNGSQDALRLDNLEIQFIAADRKSAEPIPAETVSAWARGKQPPPRIGPQPSSPLPRLPKKPDPNVISAIVDHEFLLKLIPAGETVSGFLFFDNGRRPDVLIGAKLYLTGAAWARTSQPLMFFEISFEAYLRTRETRR